uniref:Uncharacterized protein n=1 Tax=Panagrolaimus sp. PS1159 TaxID=55785 RepID=A0AC35GV19_9BILA
MTKTRSVEEFETSLVQLYYKSDILFKYGASRNFEWNRKRELEWDRIYTILRKLHSKEISKIQTVFQLKTKIWKLIQMTKKKYQRHLLFPAYPKSFSKVSLRMKVF